VARLVLVSPARPVAALDAIAAMEQRFELRLDELRAVGDDIRIIARPRKTDEVSPC
jgi:hypothetical protein